MTYIEQAIKEAVEKGGYNPSWNVTKVAEFPELKDRAILDPFFWSSLGKAREWGLKSKCHNAKTYRSVATIENNRQFVPAWYDFCEECKKVCIVIGVHDDWQSQWHSFISHLAELKSAESFFAEMYTKV